MKKFIYILLCTVVHFGASAQNRTPDFDVFTPEYVSSKASFQTSIISAHQFDTAAVYTFYINTGRALDPVQVRLHTSGESNPLNYRNAYSDTAGSYQIVITVNSVDHELAIDDRFEIIIDFTSVIYEQVSLGFYCIVETGKNETSLKSKSVSRKIRFYKPQKIFTGRAFSFNKNSSLIFSPPETDLDKIIVEYWAAFDNTGLPVLQIYNKASGIEEVSFFYNEYQLLSFSGKYDALDSYKQFFVSEGNWYHYLIEYNKRTQKAHFYINGYLFAVYKLSSIVSEDQIQFRWVGEKDDENFRMDMFKAWGTDLNANNFLKRRNRRTLNADSSKLILKQGFDSDELSEYSDEMIFKAENFNTVESDVPVFAKAPDLDITPLGGSYYLEWRIPKYSEGISAFTIEKSIDNSSFYEITDIPAEPGSVKTSYSFVDNIDPNSNVVYYRLKQLNKDSTVAYSPQVKVGQGTFETFALKNNYPNPFNPETTLNVEVLEKDYFKIVVHNLEGKLIKVVHEGQLPEGEHNFKFDGSDIPSGIYIYTVSSSGHSQSRKMILAK